MARRFTSVFAVMAALFALLLMVSAPALAHHNDGHDGGKSTSDERNRTGDKDGDADSDSNTAYTEDNDNDGVKNNVSDDDDTAHPSGKDRSTENGGSGNQGKSESTPDQDGHGPERDFEGTDKPNGAGGVDKEDQDGNNGCGNDDDFEDDNEGWCGQKPKKSKTEVKAAKTEKPCDADHTMKGVQPCEDDEVAAAADMLPAAPSETVLGLRVAQKPAVKAAKIAPAQVRGARVRGGVLPFTGASIAVFLFIALGLVTAGYLMLKARRTTG